MGFSPSILAAAKEAAEKYPGDLEKAKEAAFEKIVADPAFPENKDLLIRAAISRLVWEARNHIAGQTWNGNRREASGHPAKIYGEDGSEVPQEHHNKPNKKPINPLDSRAVRDIYAKYYNHPIGGKRLGAFRGSDLDHLIDTFTKQRNGYDRNIKLLEAIKPHVKADQFIDNMPKKKLKAIFDGIMGREPDKDVA